MPPFPRYLPMNDRNNCVERRQRAQTFVWEFFLSRVFLVATKKPPNPHINSKKKNKGK